MLVILKSLGGNVKKSPNQSSNQKRLANLRDELSKIKIPSYPDDPYLFIKEWIAKATPIMRVDWARVFDDFSSQVAISDWTNLGFAIYGGFSQGSLEHQQAWTKDAKEAQEFCKKVLCFLDGLLELPLNDTKEVQQKRFHFLKDLYEITDADETVFVNPMELGAELGLSSSETERICGFLKSEELIGFDIRDFVCIKHKGVIEVEEALSKPNESTKHFAPTNYIIQIDQMIGSQIQQGTSHNSQVLTYNNNDIEAIQRFISDLQNKLPELKLTTEAQAEVEAELTTLESQVKSPRPKFTIIKECLLSVRTILEGMAGNVIAAMLMQQISTLVK